MCTYFKTEADAAQKLWLSEDPSIGRSLSKKKKKKKMGVRGYFLKKNGSFTCRTKRKSRSSHW